jgi:hypothetical protein
MSHLNVEHCPVYVNACDGINRNSVSIMQYLGTCLLDMLAFLD